MKFDFHKQLVQIWGNAVELYRNGHQESSTFPIEQDLPFLESIGMNRMDVFDFAEDWVCMGEPDLATFLLIHEQRKDYFWETQKKVPSTRVLDPSSLPAKNESLHGIAWLPRIIAKARAKLLGELDPTTMYCCGGDRHFFQTNQIHPAEFLRVVKRADNDDSSIVKWVLNRKNETK